MSSSNGKPRKHVLLGMPGYGQLTGGAARGFFQSSRGTRYQVDMLMEASSLLAHNMNRLWCWALNEARKGRCDFFAMQHTDIEPEELWLDKLIDELEANDLDVLGVVAPLKGIAGTTSTALARPDGNNWRVHCRLTMKEVYRLPATFTSEDVGYQLLLNTGLWVCRFDESWAKKCHFEINDRINCDPESGNYYPENEPEDWYFSRQLHELGLRVGATRKVELGHRGEMVFGNTNGWGTQEFDKVYLSESVVPAPPWFPEDVAGWLSEQEGVELARLAAGKDVLEIGSYCGRSTICLAQNAKSVTAVDPFDGRATPEPGGTLQRFLENIHRHGVNGRVAAEVGTSAEVLPKLAPASFDLVFIDGAHDRESVETDIRLARELLRPGGLLAFHDYRVCAGDVNDGRFDPGVTGAVNELLGGGAELLGRFDSLAVVRPPVGAPAHSFSEV